MQVKTTIRYYLMHDKIANKNIKDCVDYDVRKENPHTPLVGTNSIAIMGKSSFPKK